MQISMRLLTICFHVNPGNKAKTIQIGNTDVTVSFTFMKLLGKWDWEPSEKQQSFCFIYIY